MTKKIMKFLFENELNNLNIDLKKLVLDRKKEYEIYKKFNLNTLTKEQKKEIDNVWKGINVDYRWFSWFNMFFSNIKIIAK